MGNCNLIPCAIFFFGYFQVFIAFMKIFVDGGVGKNGSTVAVRMENQNSNYSFNFLIYCIYMLFKHILLNDFLFILFFFLLFFLIISYMFYSIIYISVALIIYIYLYLLTFYYYILFYLIYMFINYFYIFAFIFNNMKKKKVLSYNCLYLFY